MDSYDLMQPLDVWQTKSRSENCLESLNQNPLLIFAFLPQGSGKVKVLHTNLEFFESQLQHSNHGSEAETVMPFPRISSVNRGLIAVNDILFSMTIMKKKTLATVLWSSWARWQGRSPALCFWIHRMPAAPECFLWQGGIFTSASEPDHFICSSKTKWIFLPQQLSSSLG